MGGGAILGGLVLSAGAMYIMDLPCMQAAGFALTGAALPFFGFMHGETIGLAQTPGVAVSYLAVHAMLAARHSPRGRNPPLRQRHMPRRVSR